MQSIEAWQPWPAVLLYLTKSQAQLYNLLVFSSPLLQLTKAGFPSPSPIQAQSWPVAMEGRDIVAIAKTGSGKTLGYLMPGFTHLQERRNNSRIGPTVLVLAPTRELATQIHEEARKFGASSRINATVITHGKIYPFFCEYVFQAKINTGPTLDIIHRVTILLHPRQKYPP